MDQASGVTIMTFVLAGVLFTLDDLMTAFTGSMFGDNDIILFFRHR